MLRRSVWGISLRILLATALLALATVPAGCSGKSRGASKNAEIGSGTAVDIDYGETPAQAATRLAKALVTAKTAEEVRPLAFEALARTGIAVKTPADDVLAPTGDRALSLWLFESQADNLALDFLEHQGWTLADFTLALSEHPEGPGAGLATRPEAMTLLLREWAAAAAAVPDDPEAFAPLLLAEIARARGGGSDFTAEGAVPEQVELTYLELMILTAGAFKAPASGSSERPTGISPRASIGRFLGLVPEPAHAEGNPCTWIQEKWGEEAQDFGEEGAGALFDKGLDKVKDWLAGVGDGSLSGGMSKLAGALKWANFLTSMIALYGGFSLTLTWNPQKPHYLGYDGGHGDVFMEVTANVSTRPAADDATLDCLKWAGVEKPKSDSVKDCTVEWVPLYGTPKHAEVASKDFKRQAVSPEGKAVIKLNMKPEKSTEAGKTGKIKNDKIVIQADLTTYKSTPSKIMAAALGGVASANIEVAKGWINKWFPKRAVATIPVEWHKLPKWKGTVERPDGTRWVFLSGEGAKSIWTVTLEGGPINVMGIPFKATGKASFDLTSGSGKATLLRNMVGTISGVSVTHQTQLPLDITLGGTEDAPTLEVVNGPGSNVTSAMGQSKAGPPVEAGGSQTVTLTEVEEE